MRVLIADDHRLIIEGVKLKLRELGDHVEFVEAETVDQLRKLLNTSPLPDLALIDMAMPGADGLQHIREAVEKLRTAGDLTHAKATDDNEDGIEDKAEHRSKPGSGALKDYVSTSRERPVIVLSGTEDSGAIRQVLDLGVQGYIPKSSPPDVILNAVRLVVGGGVYVPPEAMKPAGTGPHMATSFSTPSGDGLTTRERLATVLTERQIDVLKLLAKGKPNKLIARELAISEGTVKIHLAAIFRALHVRNRLEALVAAQHLGD